MTNNSNSIKDQIRNFIKNETLNNQIDLTDDLLIFKEGLLDSMGFIRTITFLDESFGIKTKDEDLVEKNFQSISAITEYTLRKQE